MTGPDPTRQELRADAAIDEIERDIERTRQELGETVSALSDKLDVKSRVQEKAQATKNAAVGKKLPLAAMVAAIAVAVVIWRRNRRRE